MQNPAVDLESELVDLSQITLEELRNSTAPALVRSVRHLVANADDPWLAALRLQASDNKC